MAVAVIAMFGISASAASFSQYVPGDFGVFAVCSADLLPNTIVASATMFEVDYDYIEIVEQKLEVQYVFSPDGGSTCFPAVERTTTEDKTIDLNFEPPANCEFRSATYNYESYYIANGVADCHIYHGPVALALP